MSNTQRERSTWMRRTVAGVCLALATTGAIGATAVAAQEGSSTTEAPAPDAATQARRQARLERACARVPVISERVDGMISRLEGGADTKGSLAWLQTRIDTASQAGRDQMVTVLQNRLEVRTARLDVLHERRDALSDLAQICDEKLG